MAAKKTAPKTTESPAATPKAAKIPSKTAKKSATPADPTAAAPVTAKKAAPAKKAAKKAATAKNTAKPTLEELTRAAYLNYRRRVELGLPGDSHGDWLEAERTLGKP